MKPQEELEPQGLHELGASVETACMGKIRRMADTPYSFFRGEVVYFCLESCKEDFEREPRSSCLVSRLFEQDRA